MSSYPHRLRTEEAFVALDVSWRVFNATRLTTPLSALAVVVVPSILGAACAEPAPLPARRSALFRPVVEIPAALDEREKLARTDTASCGVSGPAAGRPPLSLIHI